jgi:hypothetical protein
MPDPISGVLAAAGVASSVSNIFGAQSAAEAQKEAAQQANAAALAQQQKGLDTQKQYFDAGNKPLSDIATKGVNDYAALEAAIPGLTAPITMDQKTLEATPGYQFNLDQGIRGVNLSGVGSGLSGAQAKAAARYATGLADSTYQNQFNNANTNKQNAFNFLLGTAQLGTSAAGQYGANSTSAGNAVLGNSQQVGNTLSGNITGAGNAQAAADIATGKNVGNIFNSVAGSYASAPSNNPFGNYGMYGATKAVSNYNSGNPIY